METNQIGFPATGESDPFLSQTQTRVGYTDFYPHEIVPGKEYDSYIPEPKGNHTVKKSSGTTYDTVKIMRDIALKSKNQTAKIADKLKGKSLSGEGLRETVANIEDFLQKHIPYRYDGGNTNGRKPDDEEIVTPARLWHHRNDPNDPADCDDYSTFASSVLNNLKIKHAIRKVAYGDDYQHVYVIVPKDQSVGDTSNLGRDQYFVIDPVIEGINNEKPFTKNHDTMSRITTLSGTNLKSAFTSENASEIISSRNTFMHQDNNMRGLGSSDDGGWDEISNLLSSQGKDEDSEELGMDNIKKVTETVDEAKNHKNSFKNLLHNVLGVFRDTFDPDDTTIRGAQDLGFWSEIIHKAKTPGDTSWQARYGAYAIGDKKRCQISDNQLESDYDYMQNRDFKGDYVRNRRGSMAAVINGMIAEISRRNAGMPCNMINPPSGGGGGGNGGGGGESFEEWKRRTGAGGGGTITDPGGARQAGFGTAAMWISGGLITAAAAGLLLKQTGVLGQVEEYEI